VPVKMGRFRLVQRLHRAGGNNVVGLYGSYGMSGFTIAMIFQVSTACGVVVAVRFSKKMQGGGLYDHPKGC
jgi:hypothetical protein